MSAVDERTAHVRLVPTMQQETRNGPVQTELFPDRRPWVFAALDMSSMSRSKFRELLESVRPRWLVDLRPVPRFDIDGMSRELVFGWFGEIGTTYRDFAGLNRIESRADARLNPALVAESLSEMLSSQMEPKGPIFVLWDDAERANEYSKTIPGRLPSTKKVAWEVLGV